MRIQRLLEIGDLPGSSLAASAAFMAQYLDAAQTLLGDPATEALAIVLSPASPDHSDWRIAIARDLAREFAPKRVNVAAGSPGETLGQLLAYLGNAPGVTGHYVEAHD